MNINPNNEVIENQTSCIFNKDIMKHFEPLSIPDYHDICSKEIWKDKIVYQKDYNKIIVYSVPQKKILHALHHGDEYLQSFLTLLDNYLVSLTDNAMRAWNLNDGKMLCVLSLKDLKNATNSGRYSIRRFEDNKFVFVGDKDLRVFQLIKSAQTSEPFKLVELQQTSFANSQFISMSQVIGNRIALLDYHHRNGRMIIFDLIKFKTLKEIELKDIRHYDTICMSSDYLIHCHLHIEFLGRKCKQQLQTFVYDAHSFQSLKNISRNYDGVLYGEDEFHENLTKAQNDYIERTYFSMYSAVRGSVLLVKSFPSGRTSEDRFYSSERTVALFLETGEHMMDLINPITMSLGRKADNENINEQIIVQNENLTYGIVSTPSKVLEKAGIDKTAGTSNI